MILTDEQVQKLYDKMWDEKKYSYRDGVRVIECAVLEQVAQVMLKDNDKFDSGGWAMCERDWAERLRQMAKDGQG